ncbi:reverse transcriptase [Gossypium australe]|uniref:Reverse transcriptase n=1 Tax=Gossypium australe TaxID=47621 RepID=A0A5B6WHE3_9ROSI|nr:reverse transcriptase [Gossypium australe]
MAHYKALYGRKCRTPLYWTELSEKKIHGVDLVRETKEKVKVIQNNLKATSDQIEFQVGDKEFQVGDKVFLKVSPWKKVLWFGRKGKLSPRFIRPYEITEKVGPVAYRLALPPELHRIHNVSMCLCYDSISQILHMIEEATWESEDTIRKQYPKLFTGTNFEDENSIRGRVIQIDLVRSWIEENEKYQISRSLYTNALYELPDMARLTILLYGYPELPDNSFSKLPVKINELPVLNSYEFPVIARISLVLHGSHEHLVIWIGRYSEAREGWDLAGDTSHYPLDLSAQGKFWVKNKACKWPYFVHKGRHTTHDHMHGRVLKVKETNVWKTVFRTRYRHYESLVMQFVLINASASFIDLMNLVFHSYLDQFIVVFI